MNTPKIFGMLAIGLFLGVAGTAAALGADVGGLVQTSADAHASYGVDYSGVLDTADELKGQAQAEADAKIAYVQAAVADGEAKAEAKGTMAIDHSMKSSAEVKTSLFDDVSTGLGATFDWFGQLFVTPEVTPPSGVGAMHVAKDVTTDIRPGYVGLDAIGHADLTQDLESTANVDYNLPPPPTPKIGFLAQLQASFEWIAELGA
jgi:hypothetical protein